ncbi:MAG: transglycosylase SLT domain-containing protein [Pyrinomonadaceae bacterium]
MIQKGISIIFTAVLFLTAFTAGCSAQTEEQALKSLRDMTKDGKLPAESVVADIERRFAGRTSGTLARLLHARIKFENKDFAGAAALLETDEFTKKTKLGDYALWLRGQALQSIGNHPAAIEVFTKLENEFPNSIHLDQAKLKRAESALLSGKASTVPAMLAGLTAEKNANAFLLTAKAYEADGDQANAIKFYRSTFFDGAGSAVAKEAETKLVLLGQSLAPTNAAEAAARAHKFFAARNFSEADKAYSELAANYAAALTPAINLNRLIAAANARNMANALAAFNAIPASADEKEQTYYELTLGYAKNKLWPQARQYAGEMREKFPNGKLTPKAWVEAGYAARDQKNKSEENYFLGAALANYPNAIEVAGAQFELAWLEHEAKNFAKASEMLIDHLARYADKDTTNRGKAGYWAARDSERAGQFDDACILYFAVNYRYNANWYGYLAEQRLDSLKLQDKCGGVDGQGIRKLWTSHSPLAKAEANLRTVTVAAETSGPKELERAEKSDQLSIIGLFDWAIDELNEAKKTSQNSPKINLALARHYRFKGDNVNALLALAKSYPDYAQMFPEEMGREEWEIFYPQTAWDQIVAWSKNRNLDMYQVAGLIRQESVFNTRAKSGANAYGLMQLLPGTARLVARKYGSTANLASPDALFQPALNIELGTGYMRDQLDKFGRIEYMAVAYNAGPGRVAPWRASLPLEIDEFVEAIPFKETKGYVQGVIRNSAQYRRLYDEKGNFKPNVGTRPLRGQIDSKPPEQFATEFPEVILVDESGE